MIWIPLRILLAGLSRYLDGSSLDFPRIVTNILLGLLAGWTVWGATSNLTASVIVAINAGVCITLGQTHWTSWKWQALRGGAFGFGGAYLLTRFSGIEAGYGTDIFALCYVVGYVAYYGVNKITPPFGHFEQWCRVIQGTAICGAGAFL